MRGFSNLVSLLGGERLSRRSANASAGPSSRTSTNPCTPRAKKIARPLGKADYDWWTLAILAMAGALLVIWVFTA